MKIFKIVIILLFFGLISIATTRGQDGCETILTDAINNHYLGKYDACIQLLEKNLNECRFSKTDLTDGLKILASSYYEIDEIEKGDSIVYRFLKKNPNYVINRNVDPYKFVQAYSKFNIKPVFNIGLRFGPTYPKISVVTRYQIYDAADYTKKYDEGHNTAFFLDFSWNINNQFSLQTGLGIGTISFTRDITISNYLDAEVNESSDISFLPINLCYNFRQFSIKGFYPSVFAGVSFFTNLGTDYSFKYVANIDSLINIGYNKNLPSNFSKSMDDNRHFEGFLAYNLGLRVNYEYPRMIYFASFSYTSIPSKMTSENRFTNDAGNFDFYYACDDYKLDFLMLNFGFEFKFNYKVKHKYKK